MGEGTGLIGRLPEGVCCGFATEISSTYRPTEIVEVMAYELDAALCNRILY